MIELSKFSEIDYTYRLHLDPLTTGVHLTFALTHVPQAREPFNGDFPTSPFGDLEENENSIEVRS